MLKIWFNQYKYYALAIAFLVYSIGVWNVSSGYASNDFNKERLRNAEEIIKIKTENEELLVDITKRFQDQMSEQRKANSQINKDTIDAITTNPIYQSCVNDKRVLDNYKRKLKTQ